MELSEQTKQHINDNVYMVSGMSYEEFSRLDFDKQQEIIRTYHRRKKGFKKNNTSLVMIGSGENAMFIKAKKRG